MKRFLRSQLERKLPFLTNNIRAFRHRRYFRRLFSQLHASVRHALYPNGAPIIILSGPFRGLRYFDETVWGSITPKWLGSYEAELHPIVQQIIDRAYPLILNVGSAEGYYGVGLAVAIPTTKVITYDTDSFSRKQVFKLARLNGVDGRIKIEKFCDHRALETPLHSRTLVICDIEGFENELLDPHKAPSLCRHDILVEVHETSDISTATEDLLYTRFSATHEIARISACSRDSWIEQYGQGIAAPIPRSLLAEAVAEHRSTGRVWLWMETKSV